MYIIHQATAVMDNSKSCHSSASDDSTSTTTNTNTSSTSTNNRDQYLRHLNKISHKISKPIITTKPPFVHHQHSIINHRPPVPPPPAPPSPQQPPSQPQNNQPPVYNINKSDFRDVVQKLTGSPAHERFSTPPPIQPPKPPSSRLQRIRPPPLAQISNRPPPPLPINPGGFIGSQRPAPPPLSPLPPFPAVHAAAESPISAYMRYLQGSIPIDSDPKRIVALSPRWNNFAQSQPHQYQQNLLPPPSASQYVIPTSPLAFGCLPSPTAAGQLGFQQFPVSPRLPIASPRWKER